VVVAKVSDPPCRPPCLTRLLDDSGPLELLLLLLYFTVLYFVRRRALSVATLAHVLSMVFLVFTAGHYVEKVRLDSSHNDNFLSFPTLLWGLYLGP
jgi:hypothetical protein